MNRDGKFRRWLYRPESALVASFAVMVLLGTAALRMPVCHAEREIGLLDSLFTATSAVCVTGLTTRETATEFSRTGQSVILALIQLGGLGVMTFGALAFQILRRKASFRSQAAIQDAFFQGELRGSLKAALRRIVLLTIVFEAGGAAMLYWGFSGDGLPAAGWFESAFLSVSAFCNAGFSVYSDSAAGLRGSGVIMWTLMGLIVAGGLGYTVLFELGQRAWRALRRERRSPASWTLHTRVVVSASLVLTLGGAAALLVTGLTSSEDSFGALAVNALFQSVAARTAGFNTVDFAALPVTALFVMIPLMFVGGSPGSCAGGVKTTSVCVWLARVRARLAGHGDVTLGKRRIPQGVVRRAALILAIATLWNLAGIMFLVISENVGGTLRLEQVIFEQVSAFATVGLSTGITADLSTAGKIWVILSMFVGRLGPLTVALAVLQEGRAPSFTYPSERLMVG